MKADWEDDFEMLPEYDFSHGIRGAFAGRWTEEERQEIIRVSIIESARAWHEFALKRVQPLEAALFTYLVAAASRVPSGREAAAPFRALVRLADDVRRWAPLRGGLGRRLDALASECAWAAEHGDEGAIGTPPERLAHMERMQQLGRDAEAIRPEIEAETQRHLARSGMSAQEIERKTEETAKLWAAA